MSFPLPFNASNREDDTIFLLTQLFRPQHRFSGLVQTAKLNVLLFTIKLGSVQFAEVVLLYRKTTFVLY